MESQKEQHPTSVIGGRLLQSVGVIYICDPYYSIGFISSTGLTLLLSYEPYYGQSD